MTYEVVRRLGFALSGLAVLSFASSVHAYRLIQQTGGPGTYTAGTRVAPGSGETVHFTDRRIQFRVNNNGAGDSLTFNQTRNAVTAAFQSWQNVGCADLSFVDGGGTNATRSPADGNNTIYWAEAGASELSGPTQILGPGTLAVTIITLTGQNQRATDVDVAFNGANFNWSIGGTNDVQGVATHEVGHLLGLHHSEIATAPVPTMLAGTTGGTLGRRTLETDDVNAICYRYPSPAGGSGGRMGDFDRDGADDLAIGVPGEAIGSTQNAGMINVIYGVTFTGLTSSSNQAFHQDSTGIAGVAEADDHFGSALASGDFDGDSVDDLAVGVRNEAIGSLAGAGAVNVLYGSVSANGLSSSANQIWQQDSAGIAGVAEAGDQFGSALATGDFDGDGFDDLAVGVNSEAVGNLARAGAVNVIYGSASGLASAGNQIFDQDSSGIAGVAEAGDQFGSALASGDFDGDGFDDLAIGVRNEAVGNLGFAGAVNVIYGSPSGLTSTGNQIWDQNSSGIVGNAEVGDQFGASLAAGDFNDDGIADLAIGVSGEAVGNIASAGAANVIYGSPSGLTSAGNQMWHQNTSGIAGGAEAGDRFGASLVAGDFDADGADDLAIGVPGEAIGAIASAGAVNVIYGSSSGLRSSGNQVWHQDSSGIAGAAEEDDQFGFSLYSGNFDNDGVDDLAVGVRNEAIGNVVGAGMVNVIYGTTSGLDAAGDQAWHQDSSGIAGAVEANDGFGTAL